MPIPYTAWSEDDERRWKELCARREQLIQDAKDAVISLCGDVMFTGMDYHDVARILMDEPEQFIAVLTNFKERTQHVHDA